jgi:putative Mn2+ efflux pump MntP
VDQTLHRRSALVVNWQTWIGSVILIASGLFILYREKRNMQLQKPV